MSCVIYSELPTAPLLFPMRVELGVSHNGDGSAIVDQCDGRGTSEALLSGRGHWQHDWYRLVYQGPIW